MGSAQHTWVRDAIAAEQPLGWTDPILYELTAGARTNQRATELRSLLLRGPMLALISPEECPG